jgi:hypothetical protein
MKSRNNDIRSNERSPLAIRSTNSAQVELRSDKAVAIRKSIIGLRRVPIDCDRSLNGSQPSPANEKNQNQCSSHPHAPLHSTIPTFRWIPWYFKFLSI